MNRHFVGLSKWWIDLPDVSIFIGRVLFSIVAGFFFLHGYMYTVGQLENDYLRFALTAAFSLVMFMTPTKYATLAMRGYIEIKRLYKELQAASIIDNRTGAYNDNFYYKAAEITVNQAIRNACSVVCILIDVDLMKQINDNHGHLAGDASLRAIAQRLMEIFRDTDFVIRWGGDEFVVLGYTDNPHAMCSKISQVGPIEVRYHDRDEIEQTLNVHFSCGCDYRSFVAEKPEGMKSAEYAEIIITEVFKKADVKLYEAKAKKRLER
jgi:diguanylate cyclase (GGDEF)-like protein